MTDATQPDPHESADTPFHFADKRRIDPETGEVRQGAETSGDSAANANSSADSSDRDDSISHLDFEPDADVLNEGLDGDGQGTNTSGPSSQSELQAAQAEAAQLLEDLQRERASFTNYRNRALRDQEAARVRGIEDVLTALLPVLDDISRAREHEELTGPFAAIVDKLTASLAKLGVESFGQVGEEFDPTQHEALMHQPDENATTVTVIHVIEPGYRIGDKVVRAARVAVTGPQQ